MAGPTPVSALIHAATMVTAGVYMVARLNFVYMLSPAAMGVVALVGAFTALYAATIGFAQNDIKKVLAYSTISQLGYMFMAVGVGAFAAGIFHLFTHAFFKACLFLCAGSVIHAMSGNQDIRGMGGLRRVMPHTHWTFLFSTLAIAGVPLWSGFFSKDEILWKAISQGNPGWPAWLPALLYVVGMLGALCTAFYMFRLYYLTFSGESRADEEARRQMHESPASMTSVSAWKTSSPSTPKTRSPASDWIAWPAMDTATRQAISFAPSVARATVTSCANAGRVATLCSAVVPSAVSSLRAMPTFAASVEPT